MNKAKMNSLIAAGRAAYRKANKAGMNHDDIIAAVSDAIEDRFGEIWPDLRAADEEHGTLDNMLDLPEFQDAVEKLAKDGIPSHDYPDADAE